MTKKEEITAEDVEKSEKRLNFMIKLYYLFAFFALATLLILFLTSTE